MYAMTLLLCMLTIPLLGHGKTVYLSPPGNSIGGSGTATHPFRGIGVAWEAMQSGDTLRLQPGDYDIRIVPPKRLSGRDWAHATVIEGIGKVRLVGAGNNIIFHGGYSNVRTLANDLGGNSVEYLNALPSLQGKAHEHFVVRGIEVDGTASDARNLELSLLQVCCGARRIMFDRMHTHGLGGVGGVEHDAHHVGFYTADFGGGSPEGRKYLMDTTLSNSTIGPSPPNRPILYLYWSGSRYNYLNNTLLSNNPRNGLNFNLAFQTMVMRSRFLGPSYAGGGGERNAFIGNLFLDGAYGIARDHANIFLHNTFVNVETAHLWDQKRTKYANAFIGNIYEGVGRMVADNQPASSQATIIRTNLFNQKAVDANGTPVKPDVVNRAVPPLTINDVYPAGAVNREQVLAFWQHAYQRWLDMGGHRHYGALSVDGQPEPEPEQRPPAPQDLRYVKE